MTAATQKQAGYFDDLSDRIDRLERDFDPAPLRDALREDLPEPSRRFTSQTEIGAVRADAKMAALADAMEALGKNVASAREETQRIRLSVHKEMMAFTELVQAVETRMEQIEKIARHAQGHDAQGSARAESLKAEFDALGGTVLAGNIGR